MEAQIDLMARALVTVLGIFILVVSMVLVYVFWLWLELDREVRKRFRPPEVPRDHQGKRLRERR